MSTKHIFNDLYEYIKRHVLFSIIVVLTMVFAYGFLATHYMYNVDMLVDEYYTSTLLISAGRFSAPLLNYLTNVMTFAPFWHTCFMSIVLFIAGLLFALLFKKASGDKLSDTSVFVFWLVFVTYPVISYQLTYPIISVVIPYILVPIAIYLLYGIFDNERIKPIRLIAAVALLTVSIDMYESHAATFLTAIFGCLFLKYCFSEEKQKLKNTIKALLKFICILVCAIVLDFLLSKIICYIFCGTFEFWYTQNTTTKWQFDNIFNSVKYLIRELIAMYLIAGVSNISVMLYDICIIIGLILSAIVSKKNKQIQLFVAFIMLVIATLSLGIVLCAAPHYRMAQPLCVFVALVIMLLSNYIRKKIIKKVFAFTIGIIIINQTLAINRYTVINYQRYEYESDIIREITYDLKNYDIENKTTVFINTTVKMPSFDSTPLLINNPMHKAYKSIMYSLYDTVIPNTTYKRLTEKYAYYETKIGTKVDLSSAEKVDIFFNRIYKVALLSSFNCRVNGELYNAFDLAGCKLKYNNDKDFYNKVYEAHKDIPAYPADGYIVECDDYIVVKIYG